MPKIFAIYPTDKQQSTRFLNRINNYLIKNLNDDWYCYKNKFSEEDHKRCINNANKSQTKFIIFMGHGRSDRLFGSCAKESNDFVSYDAMEYNQEFYKNENFINAGNIGMFKNKVFFSFSCFSNRNDKNSLGRIAIQEGVNCFIGFGDIPTDYIEENKFPVRAIALYKGIITKIIKQSLYISIKNEYSAQGLVDLIKIITTKEMQNLILINNCRNIYKEKILEYLFLFKRDIMVFGNSFEKLI